MVGEDLERLTILLPRASLEELERAAEEDGLSRSALVRQLVMRYLRERRSEGE